MYLQSFCAKLLEEVDESFFASNLFSSLSLFDLNDLLEIWLSSDALILLLSPRLHFMSSTNSTDAAIKLVNDKPNSRKFVETIVKMIIKSKNSTHNH